jgi:hypothetical protein
MKKILLIIGNVTFHHLEAEELALFKTDSERKALVHDIDCVVECDTVEQAEELGEDALGNCAESYIIPSVYEKNGEVAYECENNNLPIDVESFKNDWLK